MSNAASAKPLGTPAFAEEREKLLRELMSTVAHDLKTPLASVIGSLEVQAMLGARLTPEKQAELVAVALREARRLDGFITNLLDMAKLERGAITPNVERIDIGSLLQISVDKFSSQLTENAITVNARSVTAVTDPALLARAVGLVLDNAVAHGGLPKKIEAECGEEGGGGFIRIRDHGPGVPPANLESIFNKYERVGGHANAAMGIGLAITRSIMRLLKGDATASNHAGGGAVFTLRFPLS